MHVSASPIMPTAPGKGRRKNILIGVNVYLATNPAAALAPFSMAFTRSYGP